MTNTYGWMGTILRVDLSTGKVTREPLTEELALNYIGGRAINLKIIYDETGPETDPFGPENRLIVGTGPVSGTFGLGTGRIHMTSKSPMTGILADGSGGGHFGAELKYCGVDHLIVQGKAPTPVYIWIKDDDVEIRDARHLWGKSTWDTSAAIRAELGDRDIKTLTIGPAGENLVKFAFAIADDERVAAETGMGGVLGSKNVKAIACRGSKSVKIANPDRFAEAIRAWYDDVPKQHMTKIHREQGSSYLIPVFNQVANLGIRNSQELQRAEAEVSDYWPHNFLPKILQRSISCFGCRQACQKMCLVQEGRYAGTRGMRPEYGCMASLGTQLGIFDIGYNMTATNMANQLGINAQELGPTMAMAFECYQRGILTRKDTDGLKLEWGDQKVALELMRKVAYREGFGAVLAEGCWNAARIIGKDAEQYAYHIKGKSHPDRLTAYVPAVLGFALSARGWDHLRGTVFPHVTPSLGPPKFWDYSPMYAKVVAEREHIDTGADMMVMCKWLSEFELMEEGQGNVERMVSVLQPLTGMDITAEMMHRACDRVYNLERAYLTRMGFTRDDDIAPRHFYDTPIPQGPSKGLTLSREKFEALKDAFYELRGGDVKTGAPKKETLQALGLDNVADDLEKLGVYEGKKVPYARGTYKAPVQAAEKRG